MHTKGRLALCALLLTAMIATGGCRDDTPAPTITPAAEKAPSRGSVVFDMGHGEIFSPDDTSDLGQSSAIERIEAAGFDLTVNRDAITAEDLASASGLIIAGPMTSLTEQEFVAITAFVERGGTVLLTIHVPYPVLGVPAYWGLPVATQIVMSEGPMTDPGQPSVFVTEQIVEHPVTEGVKQVLVVSGWPVSASSGNAKVVVGSRPNAWLNAPASQTQTRPADMALSSYGMLGVAEIGKGRVIVCGDDAVFANVALSEVDNARLLDNIIKLMSLMKSV